MSLEANKALVRRFYAEIDKGNIAIVELIERWSEKDVIAFLISIFRMPKPLQRDASDALYIGK